MDGAILPETWSQWAMLLCSMLIVEARHYIPLIRRYFNAKLKKAEAEAEAATQEAEDGGNTRGHQGVDDNRPDRARDGAQDEG